MDKDVVARAVARAALHLRTRQAAEGWWRDYDDIGIGASDGWVTAFVGCALAEASGRANRAAARRAARWLVDRRPCFPGFGYNRDSGPDADSTAHVLMLLRSMGIAADAADPAWLADRFLPNGGCATYPRRDGWGIAHIDITPAAWLALPRRMRSERRHSVLRFTLTCRESDHTWPAYWWRSHHYSTHWNLRLLAALGYRRVQPPPVDPAALSPFELAHALGAASLAGGDTATLTAALLAAQMPEGYWPGAPNLRVTDPDCLRPWEMDGFSRLHTDNHNLITTASAVGVLARLMRKGSLQ